MEWGPTLRAWDFFSRWLGKQTGVESNMVVIFPFCLTCSRLFSYNISSTYFYLRNIWHYQCMTMCDCQPFNYLLRYCLWQGIRNVGLKRSRSSERVVIFPARMELWTLFSTKDEWNWNWSISDGMHTIHWCSRSIFRQPLLRRWNFSMSSRDTVRLARMQTVSSMCARRWRYVLNGIRLRLSQTNFAQLINGSDFPGRERWCWCG